MCELKAYRDAVSDQEIKEKIMEFQRKFEVVAECEETELIRAARTSVALDKLIKSHQLGSMAYYYEGYPGNDYEDIVTSVIAGNTLLTGRYPDRPRFCQSAECGGISAGCRFSDSSGDSAHSGTIYRSLFNECLDSSRTRCDMCNTCLVLIAKIYGTVHL